MLYLIFCELKITATTISIPGIPTEEMSRCRTLMTTGRDRNPAPSVPRVSSNVLELINNINNITTKTKDIHVIIDMVTQSMVDLDKI